MAAGCVAIGIGGGVIRPEFVEGCNWTKISQAARGYKEKVTEATAGK